MLLSKIFSPIVVAIILVVGGFAIHWGLGLIVLGCVMGIWGYMSAKLTAYRKQEQERIDEHFSMLDAADKGWDSFHEYLVNQSNKEKE